MENKQQSVYPLDSKLERVLGLLEQLLAVQMYRGGAGQKEIADNPDISVGKVNSLVK